MTTLVEKPAFSFSELLVLIDIEGAGTLSTPLPQPTEASAIWGEGLRGIAPCLEFHGACRFRSGLAHLYEPPRAELLVSPAHVMLSITRFRDTDIWKNMFDWLDGYLADTLTPTGRGAAHDGFREYSGHGVIASLSFTRPNVRIDARDLVIEIGLRREEPVLAAIRHLFGLAHDAPIAPPDDSNWRALPSGWPLHLECSRHGGLVRFRFSAPHHDGQISTAGLCEEWCRRWLDLCAGAGVGHHERIQVSWDLGSLGAASMIHGDGAHRRDVHELHVPSSWLAI